MDPSAACWRTRGAQNTKNDRFREGQFRDLSPSNCRMPKREVSKDRRETAPCFACTRYHLFPLGPCKSRIPRPREFLAHIGAALPAFAPSSRGLSQASTRQASTTNQPPPRPSTAPLAPVPETLHRLHDPPTSQAVPIRIDRVRHRGVGFFVR